jgi:hypothetical protein
MVNYYQVVIAATLVRPLVFGPSLSDALITLSICTLYAFIFYYSERKEPHEYKKLETKLNELESTIQSLKLGSMMTRK